jgi:nucleotide-binding universal stress UspA family protein
VVDDRSIDMKTFKESVVSVYKSINIKTELMEGDAVESILEFAKDSSIDLIIMGTKGAGKVKERLVGTVAAAVTARSKVPVLVVPGEYEIEKPDGILFATNHFEKNTKALDPIIEMAKLFSASVHAVVFVDIDKADAADYLEKGRKLDEYMQFLKKTYPGITFMAELIEGKEFESAIELYHTVHETDMAAMVTYSKGFWEKILHKSATRKMIYHSHIPVLAIPAPAED